MVFTEPSTSRKASLLPDANANNSLSPSRKYSSATAGGDDISSRRSSTRRGSTLAFLDYEQTIKAFLESQNKLGHTSRLLGELDARHQQLQQSYDALSRRFVEVSLWV